MSEEQLKPIQKLHKAVSRLEIRDVFVRKSQYETFVHPRHIQPEHTKLELEEKFEWKLNENRSVLLCVIDKLIHGVSTKDIKENNIKADDKLFFIGVTFAVVYLLDESDGEQISDDVFDMFCQTNANYNSYPYLREFVNSACTRMTIEPVILPFMKPFTVKEVNEKFSVNLKE